MVNNMDLISEIDSWLLTFTPGYLKYIVSNTDAKALRETLQRARDALRWIPVEEWKPEKGIWEVTVHHDLDDEYFTSFYFYTGEKWLYPTEHGWNHPDYTRVVAVKKKTPAYTPEETER